MASIHSMTGFGSAMAEENGLRARVEIKAVNHRGTKMAVRSTPGLGAFEKRVRDAVRARMRRGMIDIHVSVVRPVDEEHPPIPAEKIRGLVGALRGLGREAGLDADLRLADILLIPGLLEENAYDPVSETEWPAVESALQKALDQAAQMREAEGRATAHSLRELVKPVRDFAERARGLAPAVVIRQRRKLETRIAELRKDGVVPADQQAIEREICFFADRLDINEELDRLQSHLAQFDRILDQGGEVGKRLEFLAQEFLRELNTSASKANDTEIVTHAVNAKVAVEKIKEQAANLE